MRMIAYVLVCILAILLFFAYIHANNERRDIEMAFHTLCDNLRRLNRERPDISKRYISKEVLDILKELENDS